MQDSELHFTCPYCKGTKSILTKVSILGADYEVYKLCPSCEGRGYHIMFETKGE